MKKDIFIISLIAVLVGTSCRSLNKLTSRDNSATSKKTTPASGSGNRTFLNDIEVTPGTVVTSKHKASTTNNKPVAKKETSVKVTEERENPITTERATFLQIKYAPMLNADLNQLTNIPLLELIEKWWGTRYCLGGNDENCIDCSGFTTVLMREIYRVSLARTAHEQFMKSQKIQEEELQEGDLVFFKTARGKRMSHVGIYLMNNKFVHASTSGGVMISDLHDPYWGPRYKAAGRMRPE